MRAFERGDDPFGARETQSGVERFSVGRGSVFGAAGIVESRVFGADGGVVESGGDGVGEGDLAVVILQDVGVGALQNAWCATTEARGVIAEVRTAATGFDADEANVFVRDKFEKCTDRVGAATDAGDDHDWAGGFLSPESARAPHG